MKSLKPFLLLLLGLLAGCATTSSLHTAANRLDNSAERFYEALRAEPVARHSAEDAALLVDATHDFDRAVDQSRSREYLRPAFDRVAERYHHLRTQLDNREYDGWIRRDSFASVTEAYLDVDRVMNYPGSRYHD
ncbi:MAG: hypothetical protein WBO00_02070 [Steroidobacteraceae bacterium]